MPGLQQIQDMFESQLGTKSMSNHDYFWRGKTRNELVATKMFGLSIVVPGQPEESISCGPCKGHRPTATGQTGSLRPAAGAFSSGPDG